jgi:hypothetical protein
MRLYLNVLFKIFFSNHNGWEQCLKFTKHPDIELIIGFASVFFILLFNKI